MQLYEMFEPRGYADEADDNTPLKLSDMRKVRLTLLQIGRLRIMRDVRKFEQEKKKELVAAQYKTAIAAPAF
jgi:hypothetical protein